MPTVFLLSPANCSGKRARMLLRDGSSIPLAGRFQAEGASIGELFAFMSSLYFRGKLAYATTFGEPPAGWSGALVIAPGRGLVPTDQITQRKDLRAMAKVPVDLAEPRYLTPLVRDAQKLDGALGPDGRAVLLGSVATDKYVVPLMEVLGDHLCFPSAFVGRGDMSRGGLMLRCAQSGVALEYLPVNGAVRHGARPPKLPAVGRLGG